jgi:integrase/recombinase XerC/integrase/recombinase XerD
MRGIDMNDIITIAPGALTEADDQLKNFIRVWLSRLANGTPREETVKTYLRHISQWVLFCRTVPQVDPFDATEEDLLQFRQHLIEAGGRRADDEPTGAMHKTMALKLTVIGSFYREALKRGLCQVNPAASVKPPRNEDAEPEIVYLTAGEAELLLRQLDKSSKLVALRDQAMIALLLLEGLRRCEIKRLNCDCMHTSIDGGIRLRVRGKGKTAYIYPREDTLNALSLYFDALGALPADKEGMPAFVSVTKSGTTKGRRLSNQGINKIVDGYLIKAGVKKEGGSCHQLRHTAGSQIYLATKDIKAVQIALRHSTLEMASHYAQIADRGRKRFTSEIPLSL